MKVSSVYVNNTIPDINIKIIYEEDFNDLYHIDISKKCIDLGINLERHEFSNKFYKLVIVK